MTPDRVGEMRRLAESLQAFMHGKPSRAMSECLDEIERLQATLRRIADAPTVGGGNDASTLREWAAEAMRYTRREVDHQ